MSGMDRIRAKIKEYKEQNKTDYERLLISEDFYEQLHKEAAEKGSNNPIKQVSSTIIDFPRMEITKNVDYDFKLL